jgi:hypothetical protein
LQFGLGRGLDAAAQPDEPGLAAQLGVQRLRGQPGQTGQRLPLDRRGLQFVRAHRKVERRHAGSEDLAVAVEHAAPPGRHVLGVQVALLAFALVEVGMQHLHPHRAHGQAGKRQRHQGDGKARPPRRCLGSQQRAAGVVEAAAAHRAAPRRLDVQGHRGAGGAHAQAVARHLLHTQRRGLGLALGRPAACALGLQRLLLGLRARSSSGEQRRRESYEVFTRQQGCCRSAATASSRATPSSCRHLGALGHAHHRRARARVGAQFTFAAEGFTRPSASQPQRLRCRHRRPPVVFVAAFACDEGLDDAVFAANGN